MTEEEKVAFIKEYMGRIQDEMVFKIKKGRVPEDWKGHEMRHWLVAIASLNDLTHVMGKRRTKQCDQAIMENGL